MTLSSTPPFDSLLPYFNRFIEFLDFQLPLLPAGLYYESFIYFSIAVYLFETYLHYRQYKKYKILNKPAELTWINNEEFLKAQHYGLDKAKYGFFTSAFSLIKLLTLLHFQFYPKLWEFSGELMDKHSNYSSKDNVILHSLVFFTLDSIFDTLLSIPFSLYSTFVLEEKHGFNKQTIGLFITDTIKSIVLTFIFGNLIVSILLYIINNTGHQFYIYLWIAVFIIQLIAIAIYPTLIQPCFNKVEPLPVGDLRSAIESMASSVHFPLKQLYQIDGSKRSAHSNAYMYGCCGSKMIVIFDTLINQSTVKEVVAVLNHELGHWKLNHTVKNLILVQLQTFFLFFMFGKVIYNKQLYRDFGFKSQPAYIGLMLFQFIYAPVQHILSYLFNVLSRRFEFQADAYAVHNGYGKELKSGLITLQKENKGTMIVDPLYSAYHHSHPPVLQRLSAIDKIDEMRAKKGK